MVLHSVCRWVFHKLISSVGWVQPHNMYDHHSLGWFFRRAWWLSVLAVFLGVGQHSHAAPTVLGVRTGEQPTATRFVLDLSEAIEFRVFVLPNPYRVVIDLPALDWQVEPASNIGQGLIRNFRFGLFEAGMSRVVLDVDGPVKVQRSFLLPPNGAFPHRFVLDIASVSAADFTAVAGLPPPPPLPARTPAVAPRQKGDDLRPVIVLDPGHGGIDPGTVGASGSFEKKITLRIAKELKRQLEDTGRYRVLLTRDKDVFVRLGHRVKIAREAEAALFVSLHADSIRNRRVRGAAVYTLSETASDAEAAALAAKENRADVIAGLHLEGESSEVTTILIDLTRRETMNLSAEFASLLVPEIRKNGKVLRNDHRVAGFAVLKAPDVPSILVEMGYLSNRQDEKLLLSRAYQKRISTAMVRAIDRYFRGNKR